MLARPPVATQARANVSVLPLTSTVFLLVNLALPTNTSTPSSVNRSQESLGDMSARNLRLCKQETPNKPTRSKTTNNAHRDVGQTKWPTSTTHHHHASPSSRHVHALHNLVKVHLHTRHRDAKLLRIACLPTSTTPVSATRSTMLPPHAISHTTPTHNKHAPCMPKTK